MKRIMPLLLIAGGYLAWHLYKIKQAIDLMTIRISNVSLNPGGGLLQTLLNVTLTVYNPENVTLKFQQFIGSVNYNGEPIANFNVTQASGPIVIGPNSVVEVPMNAEILNINALSNLGGIISSGLKDMTLVGIIIISSIHVPVNINLADYAKG